MIEAHACTELAMVNTEHLTTLENKTEELRCGALVLPLELAICRAPDRCWVLPTCSLKATEFNRVSTRVSRHMWWASKKMQIAMGIVLLLALVIVYIVYATNN